MAVVLLGLAPVVGVAVAAPAPARKSAPPKKGAEAEEYIYSRLKTKGEVTLPERKPTDSNVRTLYASGVDGEKILDPSLKTLDADGNLITAMTAKEAVAKVDAGGRLTVLFGPGVIGGPPGKAEQVKFPSAAAQIDLPADFGKKP